MRVMRGAVPPRVGGSPVGSPRGTIPRYARPAVRGTGGLGVGGAPRPRARRRRSGRPPVQAIPAALAVDAASRLGAEPQALGGDAIAAVLALAVLALGEPAQGPLDLLAVLREQLDQPVVDLTVAHDLREVGVFVVSGEYAAHAVRDRAIESSLLLELAGQPLQRGPV